MNINQIGQKKKKQAVRRLSQSSPATQGNRKEDIRRILEARRLDNAQGQGTGRLRSLRGTYSRRGKSYDRPFASGGPGHQINRNPKTSQVGVRKHVSPLVDPGATSEESASAGETSHATSTSTSKLAPSVSKSPMKDNDKQENVFGSSLFKTSVKCGNIFGSSQFGSGKQGNNTFVTSQSQQQSSNVFGSFASAKPTEKTESTILKTHAYKDTNISKSNNIAKIHPSPLTTLTGKQSTTNNPRNIFDASTTTEKTHFGNFEKKENIFMSSKSEKITANVFGTVLEEGKNLSSQTDSDIAVTSASNVFASPHGHVFGSAVFPLKGITSSGHEKTGNDDDISSFNTNMTAHVGAIGNRQEEARTSHSSSVFSSSNGSNVTVSQTVPPGNSIAFDNLPFQGSIFGSAGLPPSSSSYLNPPLFQTPALMKATLKDNNPSLAGEVGLPLATTSVFHSDQAPSNSPDGSGGRKRGGRPQEIEMEKILSNEKVVSPKLLKTTSISTGVDISGLTSIVIKGLKEDYINKELLTSSLSVYGKIKKVLLQPTRESAVITFHSHESAKKAKSKALELFPLKDLGVFWFMRRRSSSESSTTISKSGHKTSSEVNKRELNSRKMSIANTLRNIDASTLPSALTAQERFAVLDDIDKKIRQAVKPYTDLATAPTIVGVCPDMCPEKERYMREARVNLSVFEIIPDTQDSRDGDVPRVDHMRAVKEYSRSAADQLEPLAHEMRPVAVLQMTLDYLAANVMDNGEGRLGEWFNFLWDRTRAIRKDISQQHFCNVECVELVEKITRFHIFCAHYLCEEDMHSFDPKINNENLTKCLQTLKQFYLDLHSYQNVVCAKEAEFQAYDILLNLNEGDTLRKAMQYRMEVRNSPEVKFALEVFSSLNSNNYVRFFKLLKTASYLNACIMHRYFTQVRSRTLQTMTRSYRPQEPYPQQALLELLAFEDKEELIQFCAHYNLTTSDDCVIFSKLPFVAPETVHPLQRANNVIEGKRICSIGEVVSGSPLIAQRYHEPVCSFDSCGRYTGLASLVELLGATAAVSGDEAESPDISFEPIVSVPSEQRTPEVAQAATALDVAQLIMQEIQNSCVSLLGEAVDEMVREISEDVVNETKLKLEVSQVFADEFIDKSLLVLVREIANQCVNEEMKIKREKIAVAESRNRASVMILRKILEDVLKSELIIIAKNVRSEIHQQLRTQSFLKMSAVIMKEMSEEIVAEQCRDIAFTSRKETVDEKKAALWELAKTLFKKQQKKYFIRWCKEYRTRVHIKDILVHMPAVPPMLTTKQQVDKLFNNAGKDISAPNELSPSQLFFASFSEDRKHLQRHFKEMIEEHESKRRRSREPVDIPRILSEMADSASPSTEESNKNNLLKLVISLPDRHTEGDSRIAVDELIKCKFCGGAVEKSNTIPSALENKVEALSCYTSETQTARNTRVFKIDIKACSGVLSSEESLLVQGGHVFLGLTGVLFLLNSSGRERDEMFWTRSRTRLRQILKSKPSIPSIPLAILNTDSLGGGKESIMETELNLGCLITEGLISHWACFTLRDETTKVDPDDLHKRLVELIQWLTSHYTSVPCIECVNLKRFVEKEVLKHFTIPLYEEITLRRRALLQPQCPEVIIELYNAVIDHIINVVTNAKLKDISWPIPEFITTSKEDFPIVSWNSSENLQRLHKFLGKLKLQPAPSAAQDGKWKSERTLCLDFVNILISKQPLKNFGYSLVNSVEMILNLTSEGKSNHSPSALTAADVPWPQIVETCVGTMLSWLHSTPPSLVQENVYYMEKDLETFTEPALWRVAITDTLKMAKGTALTRVKEKKSIILCNLTAEVEEELERLKSIPRILHSPELRVSTEDIERNARLLGEKLRMEKRNCERFEEQLKTLLDEEGTHVERADAAQGVKRKCDPRWTSNSNPEKTIVKKVDFEIEGIHLPDVSSTLDSFETSLVTFHNQLKLQRHVEEFTEQQLRQNLECSP